MKKMNKEYVKEWLLYAKDNLIAAKLAIKAASDDEHFIPYHTINYMCQQSAEKYLKAYLIYNGWILKKVHDLEELLKFCINYDQRFKEFFPECKILNEYITEGRYPGDLPWESIGEKEATKAIDAVDRIAEFVSKKIDLD